MIFVLVGFKFSEWEPSLQNPYQGTVYWEKSTDYIEFDISLYRGINDDSFEDKDWSILIESVIQIILKIVRSLN